MSATSPPHCFAFAFLPFTVSLFAGPIGGEDRSASLEIEEVLLPLETGEAVCRVYLHAGNDVDAFSFGIAHDASLLELVSIERGSALQDLPEETCRLEQVSSPFGAGAVIACATGLGGKGHFLRRGERHEVLGLRYRATVRARANEVALLALSTRLGTPPVDVVVAHAGSELDVTVRDGRVVFAEDSTSAVRFFAGEVEIDREVGRGTVAVFLDHGAGIDAFSFGLSMRCGGFRFVNALLPEYFASVRRGADGEALGPDYTHVRIDREGELEVAVVLALSQPFATLAPHERRRLAEIEIVENQGLSGGHCAVDFRLDRTAAAAKGRDLAVLTRPAALPGPLSGHALETVDPNFHDLRDGTWLTTDGRRLASGGAAVLKLAADGLTPLLLRARTSGPGAVRFQVADEQGSRDPPSVGWLQNLGRVVSNPLDVEAVPAGNEWVALAVLVAPEDFVRAESDGDQSAIDRPLRIEAERLDGSGDVAVVTVRLVRPPVLLLHGLWSSARTWDWPLEGDPRFPVVHAGDYSGMTSAGEPRNAIALRRNMNVPRREIEEALRKAREEGIAATRADAIGHSMGGLLLRLYAADYGGNYHRPENFLSGDLHKLITLDTPHRGSPWGCFLLHADLRATILGRVLNWVSRCVDCGALGDMRPDSELMRQLPGADVPSHAIAARGGSDMMEAGLEGLLPPLLRTVLTLLKEARLLDRLLPPSLQHDMAVGRLSQEAGLVSPSPATTLFSLDLDPPETALGVHTTVTGEARVSQRVTELLDDPVRSASFAPSLPEWTGGECPVFEIPRLWPFPGGEGAGAGEALFGLAIESPSPGTVVEPGTQLAVTIGHRGGFSPVEVVVFSEYGPVALEGIVDLPATAVLPVPDDALGELHITAIGIDEDGLLSAAEPIVLAVEFGPVAPSLEEILVAPASFVLTAYEPRRRVTVSGRYSDGTLRDLSGTASTVADFRTLDSTVATVDGEGTVTAVGLGTTSVLVRGVAPTGQLVATVDVRVVSIPGDYDQDGEVTAEDCVSFKSCSRSGGGGDTTSLSCRDAFDADQDGDVDELDLASIPRLISACGEVLFVRSDANADGATDVSDGVFILLYLFSGGEEPECEAALDSDASGALDITDAIYLLQFLFLGGPPPEPPFDRCGPATGQSLSCDSFSRC